jgi:hypothetical protein
MNLAVHVKALLFQRVPNNQFTMAVQYSLAFSEASLSVNLYTLEDTSTTPSWSAFLLSNKSNFSKSTIDLDDSWDERGHYLFCYETPPLTADYLGELQNFLIQSTSMSVDRTIAFILDPKQAPSAETVQVIPIFQKGTNDFRLKDSTVFEIGNGFAVLQVGPNDIVESVKVKAVTEGEHGEIQLSLQSSHPITLTMADQLLTNQTSFPVSIPVNGPAAGCIRFELGVKAASNMAAFEIAQKYFYPQNGSFGELNFPLFKEGPDNWEIQFQVNIDPVDLVNKKYLAVAPPHGLRRTYLAFTGITVNTSDFSGDNTFPTVLDSYFHTAAGYSTKLHPVTDPLPTEATENTFYPGDKNACLVFCERDTRPDSSTPYYLTPSGNFLIEVVPQDGEDAVENGQTKWLPGLSGIETMVIRIKEGSREGDHLRFISNQAAYAPRFPQVEASHLNRPDPEPSLQPTFQTAWANVLSYETGPNQDIIYFSQPEGASLFVRDEGTADDGLLDFFEPGIRIAPDPDYCLPMVGYGGIDGDEELIADFETQIISPSRKESINTLDAPFEVTPPENIPAGNLIDSVSPQGLLTNLAQAGEWKEVILGQNFDEIANEILYLNPTEIPLQDGSTDMMDPDYKISFINLPRPLQNALQSNQLFMVMTDLANVGALFEDIPASEISDSTTGAPTFNNRMFLKGWPFNLNVGKNIRLGDYNNVLLFKFCRGKLSDWIKNPKQWTQSTDFNTVSDSHFELHLISRWLQDYFAEARDQADNPYFAYFNSLIDDPNWTGILALKVDVSVDDLPDELKGLVAGIDLQRFNAHHFGIEINAIDTRGDQLRIEENSSMFGLIYYVDSVYQQQLNKGLSVNTPVPAGPDTFDFKVLTLQVLFENTAIKDFASKIQVSMRELFGEEVIEVPTGVFADATVSLLLDGAYEEKNGRPTYTFQSKTPTKFWFDSNVINFFEFEKAVFRTFPNDDDTDTTIESRFTFGGNINFRPLMDGSQILDLFSFGSKDGDEQSDSRKGLLFRNLLLDMNFDLDNPSVVNFELLLNNLTFDLNNSSLRKDTALFQKFPLDYRKFIFGTGDKLPEDCGYLPAITPNIATNTLSGDWYGIDFDLQMGGPGALAAEAGFHSNFLIAWSSGGRRSADSYNVFVGVKLPGAGGNAKMLSLQGILKVAISDVEFLYENEAYVLKLNDIGVKFFGIVKVPPGGNTNFYLFGNPNATEKPKNLGWYAAYNKTENE